MQCPFPRVHPPLEATSHHFPCRDELRTFYHCVCCGFLTGHPLFGQPRDTTCLVHSFSRTPGSSYSEPSSRAACVVGSCGTGQHIADTSAASSGWLSLDFRTCYDSRSAAALELWCLNTVFDVSGFLEGMERSQFISPRGPTATRVNRAREAWLHP